MANLTELDAEKLEVPDNIEEMFHVFYERGWTDGLPVIPPTEERVARMLEGTRMNADEVLGIFPPAGNEATVGHIAINAVMAGCLPEYMPVLIAAVQAMLEPELGLHNLQATTHPVAPLIIVNGPIRQKLEMNSGSNLFGPANRANATIGRAVRLILLNIGGARPGIVDLSTHGQPSKYSFCIAENEEESPWDPLHVEMGFDRSANTVTVNGVENPHNINDHTAEDAENLLITIAGTISTQGNNNIIYQGGEPLFVFGPEHAHILAGSGYSKNQVKEHLFEKARVPKKAFSQRHQEVQFSSFSDDDLIPIVQRPEDFMVIVAGGGGKHSLFCPTYAIRERVVTKEVKV
ncbi:MAG: hypothetical protein JW882_16730 [Deltaproteobacteria bacterium]|nr:hypothetical protein [Deltaproteobacteria bacterium]